MSCVVASMRANLSAIAVAKTAAKMRRATRIAARAQMGSGDFMRYTSSESRWALVRHFERSLQRQPDPAQRPLIEQAPHQRDTLRHPARRIEMRQGPMRIRGPIASGLRDGDEARAQGQRRVTGEIADRQHLIAQ